MGEIETAAQMAADWWTARLEQGDREAFRSFLVSAIAEALARDGKILLSVDYDPRGALLEAVRAAGVECSGNLFSARGVLPFKHVLWVYPDHLEPKEGYGNWTAHLPVAVARQA